MEENAQLRKILYEIYASLNEMFSISGSRDEQTFNLPLEWSLESIQSDFFSVFESLIQFAKNTPHLSGANEEMKFLKDELESMRNVIENQSRIIATQSHETPTLMAFETLKKELEERQKRLDKERSELTMAAMKLGKDRETFLVTF